MRACVRACVCVCMRVVCDCVWPEVEELQAGQARQSGRNGLAALGTQVIRTAEGRAK